MLVHLRRALFHLHHYSNFHRLAAFRNSSKRAVEKLQKKVDEVVAIMIPEDFYGVGAYYKDFEQVSDEEVMFYLDKLRELRMAG